MRKRIVGVGFSDSRWLVYPCPKLYSRIPFIYIRIYSIPQKAEHLGSLILYAPS